MINKLTFLHKKMELSMEYKNIIFEKNDKIVTITLNNPDGYNAYGKELSLDLYRAMKSIKWDKSVNVVLIKANGKVFSAGGDIKEFKQGIDRGNFTEVVEDLILYLNATVLMMKKMDKIIISYVNGGCAGVGLSMALNTDISIATENSYFIGGYNGIGTTPDGGSSYVILKNAGLPRAMWFFLSNEKISATEAYNWGILSKVVKENEGDEYALKLAEKIAYGPFTASKLTKKLFIEGETMNFEKYIEEEKNGIINCTKTSDMSEAINSFIEKRRPVYKGS
jgi:enoyl-CoA hydratase/carnithine racemase